MTTDRTGAHPPRNLVGALTVQCTTTAVGCRS